MDQSEMAVVMRSQPIDIRPPLRLFLQLEEIRLDLKS